MAKPTLQTERDFRAAYGRAIVARRPKAARDLAALARSLERAVRSSLSEWHLAQALSTLAIEQVAAGQRRDACLTLSRVTALHERQIADHRKAYAVACAGLAVQLHKAGDQAAARLVLRAARLHVRGLPDEQALLRSAAALMGRRAPRAGKHAELTTTPSVRSTGKKRTRAKAIAG